MGCLLLCLITKLAFTLIRREFSDSVNIHFFNVFILTIAAGEQPWVALDLASQNALLRIWKVLDEPRVFPFKCENVYELRFEKAQKANHSLMDIVSVE